jgi:hypothetical protein
VRTGNYERKETHANDPIHFYLPDPSHPEFHDHWGDAIVARERPRDPYADLPWSCTAGGFCLIDTDYGPDPYLELGFYFENYDYPAMVAWFNSNGDTLSFMGGPRLTVTGQPLSLQESLMRDINELNLLRTMSGCMTDACYLADQLQEQYGIRLTGEWHLNELLNLRLSLSDLEIALGGIDYFRESFGGVKLDRIREDGPGVAAQVVSPSTITFWNQSFDNRNQDEVRWLVSHEFGHIWDAQRFLMTSRNLEKETGGISIGCLIEVLGGCKYGVGGNTISEYGEESRREDWAEAFAATVFRGDWQNVVAGGMHGIRADALEIASDRIAFVNSEIARFRDAVDMTHSLIYGDPDWEALMWEPYTNTEWMIYSNPAYFPGD